MMTCLLASAIEIVKSRYQKVTISDTDGREFIGHGDVQGRIMTITDNLAGFIWDIADLQSPLPTPGSPP
jgi:hypothetical protein